MTKPADTKNEQETQEPLTLEVMGSTSLMAVTKAQIDTQIATAHQFPRSLAQFQKRALEMATLDEETAESCIYSRPVGKKKNETTGAWEEQYAEGASIRLAEIVAACYGNIRVQAYIVEQTERFVKCAGEAHDLEANYAGRSETIEATVKRDGTPYSEGQRNVVAKACLSKAYRDAVFKVVPKALCKKIIDAARKTAIGDGATLEKRRDRARAWVTSLKIPEVRVFAALGVKGWSDIGLDKLETLTGLKTAIGDKDITVDEAFPAEIAAANENSNPLVGEKKADAEKK